VSSVRQTVLLVEDEPSVREVVQIVLEQVLGVRVVVAEDGVEALEKLGEVRPALVITDLSMPRLCGLGLIRHLKANPSTQAVPVVAMSAVDWDLAEALSAGAEDVLAKPFDLGYLTEMVGRCLRAPRLPAESTVAG
jgi:CheY-like chemotaxis protein